MAIPHLSNLRVLHEHLHAWYAHVAHTQEPIVIGVHAQAGADLANGDACTAPGVLLSLPMQGHTKCLDESIHCHNASYLALNSNLDHVT